MGKEGEIIFSHWKGAGSRTEDGRLKMVLFKAVRMEVFGIRCHKSICPVQCQWVGFWEP